MEEISQPTITSIIMKFQQNLCILPLEFSEGSVYKTAYTAIFERYQSIIHLHLWTQIVTTFLCHYLRRILFVCERFDFFSLSANSRTIEDDVIGVHHGKEVTEGYVDIAHKPWTQAHCWRLQEGAEIVCFLWECGTWRGKGIIPHFQIMKLWFRRSVFIHRTRGETHPAWNENPADKNMPL